MVRALLVISILVLSTASAHAQEASASGSLGAGMFGAQPATTVDLGVDIVGDELALGLGGRFRWIGSGFRVEDWDDRSDLARIARYVTFVRHAEREGDVEATVAAGALGAAVLGHGTIIGGFASGLDVDHQRFGLQLRATKQRFGAEVVVDDAIAPRIGGLRGSMRAGDGGELGVSFAGDGSAPQMDTTEAVSIMGVDASYRFSSDDERRAVTNYADLVLVTGVGVGLHVGSAGELTVGARDVLITARAEARLGTAGYVPTWMGPLYEIARRGQLEAANAGGLGGAGGLAGMSVRIPDVGEIDVSYAGRVGLPDVLTVRASAPYYAGVQAAVWSAAELSTDGVGEMALAAELRATLPRNLFVSLEAARLYQLRDMAYEPLWIATAAIGAVLGE